MAARPLPVVIYLHGSGGSLPGDGNELRQLAEMGLAAVGMEYEQRAEDRGRAAEDGGRKTEDGFAGQFTALLEYLRHQPWADTNRIAWVGYSLGAQRLLAFALQHPDLQPKLLVRLAGGWVPELEELKVEGSGFDAQSSALGGGRSPAVPSAQQFEVQGSVFKVQSLAFDVRRPPVLLIHGEHDEVFPLSEAERVAACLQTNGVPVELRVLPGQGHGLGGSLLLIFRAIGEQCLTRLKGPAALGVYRSMLSWQAQAKPLWLFWLPAFVWAAVCLWVRVGTMNRNGITDPSPLGKGRGGILGGKLAASWRTIWGSRGRSTSRWLAAVLAAAALALTGLHVIAPRLPISKRTLAVARKHRVPPGQQSDFEFLAAKPCWPGKPLKTLPEHVELANYNRELINWKLDEPVYQQFVLSPEIDPALDGDLNWRRALWENFYPRIRREQGPEAAAEIVVRFLRERVTILGESRKQKAESRNQPPVVRSP
jgi:predicted esterase